jgi:hypothetical protein
MMTTRSAASVVVVAVVVIAVKLKRFFHYALSLRDNNGVVDKDLDCYSRHLDSIYVIVATGRRPV